MPKSVQTFFHGVALILLILTIPSTARAEVVPGNACATNNQVIHSGGPENSGAAYWMVCQGGTWRQIFSVDNTGMASTNTPTAAAHVATKAYVDAQAGSNLKVYKFDGTTLLGQLITITSVGESESDVSACSKIIYYDSVNDRARGLSSYSCGGWIAGTIYWSGSNCTGTSYFQNNSHGYGCTGAGNCQTNLYSTGGGWNGGGDQAVNSSRAANGVCTNAAGTLFNVSGIIFIGAASPARVCGSMPDEYCKILP